MASFTQAGQYGPEPLLDGHGRPEVGASVTVPGGYTGTVDGNGNLTITGPPADAVTYTVHPVSGADYTTTVPVPPAVAELAPVQKVATTATTSGSATVNKHNPADATSSALTITLPTAQAEGTQVSVEKTDSTANAVNVTGSIRGVGSSTIALVLAHESVVFRADSAGSWWPYAGHKTKTSLDAVYESLTHAASSYATYKNLAALLDPLIVGTITRDANGAATSAPVVWPDGSPGTYTATTVSSSFPGAVDAYTVTYGSPVTKTYTQSAVTRDANGAVTARPAMTVA